MSDITNDSGHSYGGEPLKAQLRADMLAQTRKVGAAMTMTAWGRARGPQAVEGADIILFVFDAREGGVA